MKKTLLFVLAFLFTVSCYRQDEQKIDDGNFVSFATAKSIAISKNSQRTFSKKSKNGNLLQKEIKDITTVSKNGLAVYYVINYEGGGFIIIAADKRVSPILALSEDKNFDYENAKVKNGISFWLGEQSSNVEYVRSNNVEASENTVNAWNGLLTSAPPDTGPYDETIYSGQFLTTTWGQGYGYNNSIPMQSCGRPLTGCVATAMAQIMKYHNYSSINNYNWSSMPNSGGASETARLMYDVGQSVNMNYGCGASGTTDYYIIPGFNHFGYNSVSVKNINSFQDATLDNNLAAHNPVLFTGGDTNGYGGHAWVCDGSYYYVEWDGTSGYSMKLYHMNWGWDDYENGYFSLINLNPDAYHFGNLKMYYNIQ